MFKMNKINKRILMVVVAVTCSIISFKAVKAGIPFFLPNEPDVTFTLMDNNNQPFITIKALPNPDNKDEAELIVIDSQGKKVVYYLQKNTLEKEAVTSEDGKAIDISIKPKYIVQKK